MAEAASKKCRVVHLTGVKLQNNWELVVSPRGGQPPVTGMANTRPHWPEELSSDILCNSLGRALDVTSGAAR
jgi:hypothetical protein